MNDLSPASVLTPLPAPLATGEDTARGDGGEAAKERNGRHLRMLAELAEVGMELVREVRRQALEESGPEAGEAGMDLPEAGRPATARRVGIGGLGLVFARLARAVRQTVALEARLAAEAETGARQRTAAEAGRAATRLARNKQLKTRIKRHVEDAIADAASGHERESLLLDLDERLEDPDIEDELGQRPIGVIVAGICDDLRIEVDLRCFSDAELGFDMAAMQPGGKPDGVASVGSGLASAGSGPDAGLAGGVAPDPVGDPGADPGGGADADGPTASPSPCPSRLASGRDPP